jgi:hypothetical protein
MPPSRMSLVSAALRSSTPDTTPVSPLRLFDAEPVDPSMVSETLLMKPDPVRVATRVAARHHPPLSRLMPQPVLRLVGERLFFVFFVHAPRAIHSGLSRRA